jgi:hypothetical protein
MVDESNGDIKVFENGEMSSMGGCGEVGDAGGCVVLDIRVDDWGRKEDVIGRGE